MTGEVVLSLKQCSSALLALHTVTTHVTSYHSLRLTPWCCASRLVKSCLLRYPVYSATKQDDTHTSEMSTLHISTVIYSTLCVCCIMSLTLIPQWFPVRVTLLYWMQSSHKVSISMACLHVHCQTCVLAVSKHIIPLTTCLLRHIKDSIWKWLLAENTVYYNHTVPMWFYIVGKEWSLHLRACTSLQGFNHTVTTKPSYLGLEI